MNRLRMASLALALGALALAAPATALDKQATYDEMLALGEQIRQLKPLSADAGVAAQLGAAQARYAELSALLGGDDPASVAGGAAPAAPAVAPAPPPGCAEVAVSGSNTTPLPIPDSPAPAVSSTITISGAGTYLLDVDLTTAITHTFNGDLDFTLTSPAGTVVTVSTDNGSLNDDVFNGTLWDDQANAPAQFATYANLVVATPLTVESALGAFVGEDPNGTWTLTIGDDAALDTGTLNSWSLDLTTLAAPPPSALASGTNTTPLPIPDSPAPAVSSTIVIGGAGTYLLDVDLTTTITHTFNGDLEFTLTSPAGTTVLVSRNRGGANDNVFNGTLWNDQASAPISEAVFANLVTETPLTVESALGAFVGEDPNGTWTLAIVDEAALDTGTVNSWSLDLTTAGSCYQAPVTQEIPTASTLGLAALALLLAGAAFVALRRG
jgi:subtilisin-like proprotein convertase family protein